MLKYNIPFLSKSPISARWMYILLAVVCFLAYANTITNEYGLDDFLVTNHHPQIEKGISGLYEIFTTNYIDEGDLHLDYRPLVKASYAVEYSFFGWNPHISHFINVLLYAIGVVLLFQVLMLIFGAEYFTTILIGTLVYAVHPIHTEVVASLKNRDELLVLVFTLFTARTLLSASKINASSLGSVSFFFLLALMSKISALPFFASIPMMLYWKQRNTKSALLVFGVLGLVAAVYYTSIISLLPGFARPYEFVETPFPYLNDWSLKLGTAFYTLLLHLKLLVFPFPLRFYYGYGLVELQSFFTLWPMVSVMLYISIAAAAFYFFRKNPFISFFLFFFLVQISLYSNLVLPLAGMVAERGLFFASVSLAFLTGYALHYFFSRKTIAKHKPTELALFQLSIVGWGVLSALLLVYTSATFLRNREWNTTISLLEADSKYVVASARANYMIAKEIRRLYRLDEQLTPELLTAQSDRAISFYELALKAYPNYTLAMEELGSVYTIERKDLVKGIPLFQQAFTIDSSLYKSAYNIGYAAIKRQDEPLAKLWFEQAVKANPKHDKSLIELAKIYYKNGEKQKALACNDTLAKYYPNLALPYYNYGVFYMLEGDTVNAVRNFEQDIRLGEQELFPYQFLFKYYLQQRDTANALRVRNSAPRKSR
jgi:tetratricopeptide (TPR) repeat protein